jgi:type IV pilus assembly protein PilA
MAIRKRLKGGFTLVELMIVVAIVGVLAVLAVYGVRKYIANAKTAEAKNSLGQMGKDAVTAFEGEKLTDTVLSEGSSASIIRQLCGSANAAVPGTAPAGAKYQSTKADWSNATDVQSNKGFPCLRFEMTQPQYYSYFYGSTGPTGNFSATAKGDLNGDGTASTFTLNGGVNSSGRPTLAPSIGEVSPEE